MLEVINLTKVYQPKKGVPVYALDEVNLKFQPKGMVFVLGKSGSGKSTLLNLLGGLDSATSGEIIIKDKSSKDFKQSEFDSYRNTYVGFIFQEYNILEEYSVGANIGLAMELQGEKATSDRINEILNEVDLEGYGSRKPNELSGGQLQRVAIARALIKNPDIILADEPTGSLDSLTGVQVFNTLKKLSKDKLVIVISHDREFSENYADRIIEFSDGRVISDVIKDTKEIEQINTGIQLIENEFIHIKSGYQLTATDLKFINDYLAASKNDVLISVNENTNQEIKKNAKIIDGGKKEYFRNVTNQDIEELINKDDKFKSIRSRLPLKQSVKMGFNGIKGKPIRLFFTIFLSLIAFTLFGLANTMSAYNKIDASINSFVDANINYLALNKILYSKNDTYGSYVKLHEDDIEFLNEKLNTTFKPVYTGSSYSGSLEIYNHLLDETKFKNNEYYKRRFSGLIEFSTEEITKLGFQIYGNMPIADNEIAIPKYIYDHFKFAGFKDDKTNLEIKADDMTMAALIGKNIGLLDKDFVITAIIDTNFDPDGRYDALMDFNYENWSLGDVLLMQELSELVVYSYHALVYIPPNGIDKLIGQISTKGISREKFGYMGLTGNNFEYSNDFIGNTGILDVDHKYFFDSTKTTLDENEILIDFRYFLGNSSKLHEDLKTPITYMGQSYNSYYSLLYEGMIYNTIYDYAANNYHKAIQNGFIVPKENNDPISEYEKQMAYYQFLSVYEGSGFINNPYGINGIDLAIPKINEFFTTYQTIFNNQRNFTMYFYNNFNYEYQEFPIEKVGIYYPDKEMSHSEVWNNQTYYNPYYYTIIDDEFYQMISNMKIGDFEFAISSMPTSRDEIRKAVMFNYTRFDNTEYHINNQVSFLLEQANTIIETLAKVFLYIGIGFAVFASILMMNFIATSINQKKRDIGVLRALGSRSSDVFGIFYNESLIVTLFNFLLSTILTGVVVLLINSLLRINFGLLITLLNFGVRQIVLMLLISVFVATVSSFIPTYRISRNKPIDAIRNL